MLLDAAPDLRQQILATSALRPRGSGRQTPIAAIVLTSGEVDHVAGLLTLRERQALDVFGTAATLDVLRDNPIFAALDPALVRRHCIPLGVPTPVAGLGVTAFAVPGKVPLFREGPAVAVGTETEDTIGLEITAAGRRVIYIPGCAHVPAHLVDRVQGADVLLFDGTTYADDELVSLGLSAKTARRMGHVAIAGPDGSLGRFAALSVGRKIYTHINNTNPILVAGSVERRAVEASGWAVAHDGMELLL